MHSGALMIGDDMQIFVETLDACCELQKNIFDICERRADGAVPSVLSAFCEEEEEGDMFETWL